MTAQTTLSYDSSDLPTPSSSDHPTYDSSDHPTPDKVGHPTYDSSDLYPWQLRPPYP